MAGDNEQVPWRLYLERDYAERCAIPGLAARVFGDTRLRDFNPSLSSSP